MGICCWHLEGAEAPMAINTRLWALTPFLLSLPSLPSFSRFLLSLLCFFTLISILLSFSHSFLFIPPLSSLSPNPPHSRSLFQSLPHSLLTNCSLGTFDCSYHFTLIPSLHQHASSSSFQHSLIINLSSSYHH